MVSPRLRPQKFQTWEPKLNNVQRTKKNSAVSSRPNQGLLPLGNRSPQHTLLPYSREPIAFLTTLIVIRKLIFSQQPAATSLSTIAFIAQMSNGSGKAFGRAEEENAGDPDDLLLSKFSRMTTVYVPPTTPIRKASSAMWGNNSYNHSSNQVYIPFHHHEFFAIRILY